MIFQHKRTLHVLVWGDLLKGLTITERHDAEQVVGQTHHIAVPPSAIIHIILAIIVTEDILIDRLCTIDYLL